MKLHRSAAIAASVLIATLAAGSAWSAAPAIPGYGEVLPVDGASEVPDPALDYKVVLLATKSGAPNAAIPFLDATSRHCAVTRRMPCHNSSASTVSTPKLAAEANSALRHSSASVAPAMLDARGAIGRGSGFTSKTGDSVQPPFARSTAWFRM